MFETLLKRTFWLLFKFFFYLLNHSKTLSIHRSLHFWKEEKVSGGQVRWINGLRHDNGSVFGQKLTHKQRCISWCVTMVQNHEKFFHNSVRLWRIVSRNRCITSSCSIPYWPYDQVARILKASRHCNRRNQWPKPSHLTASLVVASIGMIRLWFQCHNHTPMIRHQLLPFWANLDRRWMSPTSHEWWPCDVLFAQNLAILKQSLLLHFSA